VRYRREVVLTPIDMDELFMEQVWKALRLNQPGRGGPNPCWCNHGDNGKDPDALHHDFCRRRRVVWRRGLRALRVVAAQEKELAI
jgi:hypothetical protein